MYVSLEQRPGLLSNVDARLSLLFGDDETQRWSTTVINSMALIDPGYVATITNRPYVGTQFLSRNSRSILWHQRRSRQLSGLPRKTSRRATEKTWEACRNSHFPS
jgi:hypothetical protein